MPHNILTPDERADLYSQAEEAIKALKRDAQERHRGGDKGAYGERWDLVVALRKLRDAEARSNGEREMFDQ